MAPLTRLQQSPTDPDFVQNPYPFYDRARAAGDFVFWDEYDMPAAVSFRAVAACLKDRRMGRAPIDPPEIAPHTAPFYAIEAHSMLELEPPRHTRLRGQVMRAFTQRRIAGLAPEIEALCHELIDAFPNGPFDLLRSYADAVPVIVIARLLGVPDAMAPQLLSWSHDMVAMYQARRTREIEDQAAQAATEFTVFMRDHVSARRSDPGDDLITALIAVEGEALSEDEMISSLILLLNAGHEATVHTIGNGVKALLDHGTAVAATGPDRVEATVEEVLRFDPPLHMFTRYVYEDIELLGQAFRRGDQIACLLGAANRDPAVWKDPHRFDPERAVKTNQAFGAGIHFCVGAPLARLELQVALRVLFARCPQLALAGTTSFADVYHFHGLKSLRVRA